MVIFKNNGISYGVLSFLVLATACASTQLTNIYGFDTSHCVLQQEVNGNHSHYYALTCGTYEVQMDYGYGVYSTLSPITKEDYLKSRLWKFEIFNNFYVGQVRHVYKSLDSFEVISISDSLVATLKYGKKIFTHQIILTDEYINKSERIHIDTTFTRRLVYDQKTMKDFNLLIINHLDTNKVFPRALSIHLKSKNAMSLEQVERLFRQVKLPEIQE